MCLDFSHSHLPGFACFARLLSLDVHVRASRTCVALLLPLHVLDLSLLAFVACRSRSGVTRVAPCLTISAPDCASSAVCASKAVLTTGIPALGKLSSATGIAVGLPAVRSRPCSASIARGLFFTRSYRSSRACLATHNANGGIEELTRSASDAVAQPCPPVCVLHPIRTNAAFVFERTIEARCRRHTGDTLGLEAPETSSVEILRTKVTFGLVRGGGLKNCIVLVSGKDWNHTLNGFALPPYLSFVHLKLPRIASYALDAVTRISSNTAIVTRSIPRITVFAPAATLAARLVAFRCQPSNAKLTTIRVASSGELSTQARVAAGSVQTLALCPSWAIPANS